MNEYKEGEIGIGDLVMVKTSQHAEDTSALALKVLDVMVEVGIITQFQIKWESRPTPTWVLSEQVSKISENRQTRSGAIPAVMSIPESTVVKIEWEGKVCEAEVIEFLPEGQGRYKEKSYFVRNPSDVDGPEEWEAERFGQVAVGCDSFGLTSFQVR